MNIVLAWVLGSAIFIPFAFFIIGEITKPKPKRNQNVTEFNSLKHL